MYVVTPFPNNLIAVDLTKPGGALKWIYRAASRTRARSASPAATSSTAAPSYADGKIIYNLLDATRSRSTPTTGKEVWRTKVGDINVGETITMAPLVVKDKVIVGNCRRRARRARLGRGARRRAPASELWRAYNTGPDADVLIGADFKPFYAKDQGKDLGVKTWRGRPVEARRRHRVGLDLLRPGDRT